MTDDWNLTVTGHDLPEDIQGVYMTSNGFNFMGVPPTLGRGLIPSDAIDGQEPQPVAVLGYKFWKKLGGDSGIIGSTITLNGRGFTVIGVAPSNFTGVDVGFAPDMYVPMGTVVYLMHHCSAPRQ